MNDSPESSVNRLSNAAIEAATRNRNSKVGPDHLLYVICSTEDGRREIEARNGDHKAIFGYLSDSFRSRMEDGGIVTPEFGSQFQLVLVNPVLEAREGKLKEITMGIILDEIIANHRICPITTAALICGGLVSEDTDELDEESLEFEEQVAEAAKNMSDSPDGKSGHDDPDFHGTPTSSPSTAPGTEAQSDPHLEAVMRATRNLTVLAGKEALDPVIGRDGEISLVTDILQRRRKGNVLLVGAPGVGKTAVAEGLAQLLWMADTPAALTSRPVLEVSVPDLLAGTRYRGDFELRLRHLMSIAKQKRAILFFDEAHMLMGAGASGASGAVDAANILKPAMARGEIQIIAATTSAEARSIRKDRALMRRFEIVNIAEPDRDTAAEILRSAQEPYSAHHGISYGDDVAEACVDLSMKHIPDRQLPDKALDLLDMAAVEAKNDGANFVSKEYVADAVFTLTGVNIGRPTSHDLQVIREFPTKMTAKVFGQEDAMKTLSSAIRISGTGVAQGGVAGSYLFNGPTGVGKTETARQMAKALGIPLVRIDMSEYMEAHSVSGLIGAPPGYVGYEDDGAMIAAAELHPQMVLLLDEVEKAHPKVFDILLQVLDDGRLTSPDGRTVSMRGVHLVMTSNIGSAEAEKNAIGFGRKTSEEEVSQEEISKTFRKELLGRIRHKIQFSKLTKDAVAEMVNQKVNSVVSDMRERGFEIEVEDSVRDMIIQASHSEGATGRIVMGQVEKLIFDPVSLFVVENEDVTGMLVGAKEGEIEVKAVFQ